MNAAHARVIAAAAALALGSPPARGAQPSGDALVVRAATPDCAASPLYPAFVDALRVELAGGGPRCCAPADAPAGPAAASATVEACDAASADVAVSAGDGARGRAGVRRHISLTDVAPAARPRALALAVAELVRSVARAAPRDAPGDAADRRPAAPSARRAIVAAAAGAELRFYPALHTTLAGGRLALSLARDRWWTSVEADAAADDARFGLGGITTRTAGASLAAGPRFALGTFTVDVGLTGEIAWARVAGQASGPGIDTDARSALVAAAGVRVRAEAPAGRTIRVQALLQLGETLRALVGDIDGRPTAGISGAYVIVGAGVSLFGGPARD